MQACGGSHYLNYRACIAAAFQASLHILNGERKNLNKSFGLHRVQYVARLICLVTYLTLFLFADDWSNRDEGLEKPDARTDRPLRQNSEGSTENAR